MTKTTGVAARVAAARAVDFVLKEKGNLDKAFVYINIKDHPDRSMIKDLTYGALRTHERNLWLLTQLTDKPLRKRDSIINALLSISLFALTETRQPEHAILNTSVEATKYLRSDHLCGLVNAVLRRFLSERNKLMQALQGVESAYWQHPSWWLRIFQKDWPQHWEKIASGGNEKPPMWLRVNKKITSRKKWLDELPEEVNTFSLPKWLDHAVCLTKPLIAEDLPGFQLGAVSVQDAGAQFAANLLDVKPGMRVLDACAAPGGKTCHILETTPDLLELVSIDVSANRLEKVNQNIQRLNLSATLIHGDLMNPQDWWDGEFFDRILLDLPCSSSGVIRRHPDIRYLKRYEDIDYLADQQLRMLKSAWQLLNPSGLLLYSTCSVFRRENEAVVNSFLGEHSDACIVSLKDRPISQIALSADPGVQLLPGVATTDGFYYALIMRRSS
ncbi:MAG: 16S rRNA (cytosine(967)-C(5))-methyltransferase RsmB [Pseudomonadota bacterium]|nr:16S rRNA (cytosine(967)-C(5))-methyltransferase RsmB [Pseudomonadota bacterium]